MLPVEPYAPEDSHRQYSLGFRAAETAKWLRALAGSPENWSSVPSIHVGQLTIFYNYSSWGPDSRVCRVLGFKACAATAQLKFIFLKAKQNKKKKAFY